MIARVASSDWQLLVIQMHTLKGREQLVVTVELHFEAYLLQFVFG